MSQLSEEQLINIEGQIYTDDSLDPKNTFNPFTQSGITSWGEECYINFNLQKVQYWKITKPITISTQGVIVEVISVTNLIEGIITKNIYKIISSLGLMLTQCDLTFNSDGSVNLTVAGITFNLSIVNSYAVIYNF